MTDHLPAEVASTLDTVLRLATGQGTARPRIMLAGPDYWIVVCGPKDGTDVVVKLAEPTSTAPSFEAALRKHERIQSMVRVPMATMIAADDTCKEVQLRFSVQSKLPGRNWFETREVLGEADHTIALAALGDVVGRLHQPTLPAFGTLTNPEESNCLAALVDHAHRIIGNGRLRDQFVNLLTKNSGLWSGLTAGITHDDLHGFNILFSVDGSPSVSGVLDFDKAWSGPVESDLARMELWRGMTNRGFLDAYRSLVPELPGYAERRPFYQLLWCLEFAQDTVEHLGTTNELAVRLGMSPVQGFA